MYQRYTTRALLMLYVSFFVSSLTNTGHAQVVAGIRANGRIMEHGDTINVCRGSSITYLSAATGSLIIDWTFTNGGNFTAATGIGPTTITYNTNGYDTTFQKVTGGAFADSTFVIVYISDVHPIAGFTFSPDNVCGNEFIQFTNTSTYGEPLTYHWNFGDGGTSTGEHPPHQFLSAVGMPGTQVFPVGLSVTNVFGCKDTTSHFVTVKKVPDASIGNADPAVSFGLFNGISTFKKCNNIPYYNFKFQNASSTLSINVSYTIQWGDGSPDSTFSSWPSGQVIAHNFPLGSSTMTVNVTGPDGCIGIRKYLVFLGTIPAGGLASLGNTDICSSDSLRFLITNIENNPPGTSYTFLINDGTAPQVFQHPPPAIAAHHFYVGSCFYSSNNGIQSYQNAFGAYLTIENPCGSNSASVVPIYVSGKPRASINVPSTVICPNTTMNISNISSYGNVISTTGTFTSECINNGIKVWGIFPSTGYTLINGSLGSLNGNHLDGSTWTDGSNSLNIQFTATGTYTIKIYIYNNRCGLDSTTATICVRNPPQSSFMMNQHQSCNPISLDLLNTSPTGSCKGDDYDWQIIYSDPEGCTTGASATYTFVNGTNANSVSPSVLFSKIGRYVIRLTVRAHESLIGCTEAYSTDTFYIKGPPVSALGAISPTCVNNSISPTASVINCYAPGPFGYQWTFPGGSPGTSTLSSPGVVQYGNTGTFPVQLIVTDSSCMLSDTVVTNVTVFPAPVAEAGNNISVCSGSTVSLGISGMAGVTYQWSPVTGLSNPAIANPFLLTNYTGPSADTVYTYYLTSSVGNNCSSLDSVKITVKRMPALTLTPSTAQVCIGTGVMLFASGADSYSWTPVAGLSSPAAATTIATPLITTTYTVTGSMNNGCFDTKNATIIVNPDADANLTVADTVQCVPVNINTLITSIPSPASNASYNWYADGVLINSNTSGIVPSYLLNVPGDTIIIKLVTVSPYGCRPDSVQRTFITRPSVTAAFTKDKDSSCAPLNVVFNNTSSLLSNNIQFFWNFGNGITSNTIQPGTISFNTSPTFRDTVYHVVLKAYNGCDTSYYRDSVKVFANSHARFAVDTTRGCSPFTIHIQNTSAGNNFVYYWDFGDGHADTTYSLTSFSHTYYTGIIRNYTIRLISQNQCTRDTQAIVIVVNPNTIQPFVAAYGNQLSGCAPHIVTFNNSSVGAAQLTWNFGDNTSPIITPGEQNSITHLYANPGNYTVSIRLQNDCSDTTIFRNVIVYGPPDANFTLAPPKICTSQSTVVTNSSTNANSYDWFWGDGNSSTFSSGQHNYSSPGVYNIMLVAKKVHPSGFVCYDTAIRQVVVVDKIPAQINVAPGKKCAPYRLNVDAGDISGYSQVEWVISDSSAAQQEFHVTGLSASHVYDVPGIYKVKLIVHTTAGCVDSSSYSFRVYNSPRTDFGPMLVKTCSHDTTLNYTVNTLNGNGQAINYKWFVNGSIEGTNNPFNYNFSTALRNTSPVEYNIQVLTEFAENPEGCADTSHSARLIMQPLPYPRIEVSPSVVLQQPDYTFTFKDAAPGSPDKTYIWYMGDRSLQTRNGKEISYQYGDTGSYKVKLLVTDFSTGCKALDSVKVSILYAPGYLYVPNAMCVGCSNNSLRQFLPLAKGLKTYRLRIYNAWGQKIFETSKLDANGSPSEPWSASTWNGKTLQQDVYSWQIEATYINGTEWKGMLFPASNKYLKAGFITIIK